MIHIENLYFKNKAKRLSIENARILVNQGEATIPLYVWPEFFVPHKKISDKFCRIISEQNQIHIKAISGICETFFSHQNKVQCFQICSENIGQTSFLIKYCLSITLM